MEWDGMGWDGDGNYEYRLLVVCRGSMLWGRSGLLGWIAGSRHSDSVLTLGIFEYYSK